MPPLSLILYLLLLLLGFPIGLILAYLCKEEIKSWRKRLKLISIICLVLIIIILFTNFQYKLPIIFTFLFMIITCLTIVWKSKKNNFIVIMKDLIFPA